MINIVNLSFTQITEIDIEFLESLDDRKLKDLLNKLDAFERELARLDGSLSQIYTELISIKKSLENIILEYIQNIKARINKWKSILLYSNADPSTINLFAMIEYKIEILTSEIIELLKNNRILQIVSKLKEINSLTEEAKDLLSKQFDKKYLDVYERITEYLYKHGKPQRLHDIIHVISKETNIDIIDLMTILLNLDKLNIIEIIIRKS